jgi:transcriptional regulator with PAS, ATPase and Fis domain
VKNNGVVHRHLESWTGTLDDFHSADPAMMRCLALARVAAGTDLPILILGESGTGKSLLARAIHNSSQRAKEPFVSFNSAALSDTLLDSQLFGHERGAFTGAEKRVRGKFELADGGTLFIDEIADMSLVAQAKVLRAVECGEFEPLGSETLHHADVRLISATHLPLALYMESKQFRKDLFYRISGIVVTIPPLRERPADLRALIAAEIALASCSQGKHIVGLDERALELLLAYPWPGNLRELNRIICVAIAMTETDVIPAEAILVQNANGSQPPGHEETSKEARRETDLTLKTAERHHIRAVLAKFAGSKRRAAHALGISRSTLDRKLLP